MRFVLAFLFIFGVMFVLTPKGKIIDSYRRYIGHVQIEAPGGCLDVAIAEDTSFSNINFDPVGGADLGFSIYRGFGYGPIAWSFTALSGEAREDQFSFSVKALFDEVSPIFGDGCYVLGGSNKLKQVSREVQGQPKVPYKNCTVTQLWGDPSFMLFDSEGTTIGEMTCHGKKATSCSGDVHIGDALFTLRLFSHSVEKWPNVMEQMTALIRKNMTFKSKCRLW